MYRINNLMTFRLNNDAGAVITAILGAIVGLLGGKDILLDVLLIMVTVDFISGIMQAYLDCKLNSKECFRGIVKKLGYFMAIALAYSMDRMLGLQMPLIRTALMGYLIANEGISGLEHLGAMGVPIPPWLITRLEQLRDIAATDVPTPPAA